MKLNKLNHLTPALSPNPIGVEGEKIGHAPPADARMDLFVTADTTRPAHMEVSNVVGEDEMGEHPMMMTRFAREGVEPTKRVIFYQQ